VSGAADRGGDRLRQRQHAGATPIRRAAEPALAKIHQALDDAVPRNNLGRHGGYFTAWRPPRPSPPTGDENHWAGAQIGCPLGLAKPTDAEGRLTGASRAAGVTFQHSSEERAPERMTLGGHIQMKHFSLLVAFAIAVLAASCSGIQTTPSATPYVPSQTQAPTQLTTPTPVPPSSTPSRTSTAAATPTVISTVGPTATPTAPPEARLTSQCLDVLPTLPNESAASGVVVLESRVVVGGHYNGETYFSDLTAGTTITVENVGYMPKVSPDGTRMAYSSWVIDGQGRTIAKNLIIVDAGGHQLKVVPEDTDWYELSGWTDSQHVVLHRHERGTTSLKYDTYLVLDPFTGQRQVLGRNFPDFIASPFTRLPYWEGWYGVSYDPTLTRAIYPRNTTGDPYRVTYGLWDVSKQRLVVSLDSIFITDADAPFSYSRPIWSPDASQFVFEGSVPNPSTVTQFELYRVGRDGRGEQVTHLNTIAFVQANNLSWSPDGRYIAIYLQQNGPQAHAAVLDTTTLQVTDYCVTVTYAGEGFGGDQPPSAVWSPDGKQFLVVDWYSKDHRRVVLVDVAKGFAAQIAQDAEPAGWMRSN